MEIVKINNKLQDANVSLSQLAERADAANQAKTDFLAKMSHEIRTPINAVIGMNDGSLDQSIHLGHFLSSHGRIVGKVKAQTVRQDQATCLMDMVAQNTLQCLLQQVGSGVGTHDGLAALHINGSAHNIVHLDGTGGLNTVVQILAALRRG